MLPYTITFYSYKGGVGRTLLAANIGVLRARKGKTLIWDLDIEAPGLHRIPDLKPNSTIQRGFFEWLLAWQQAGKGDRRAEPDLAALAGCIVPTALSGELHILPAHGELANAAELYGQIDWDAFLVSDLKRGFELFNRALEHFAALGYQTVLLDARTGITDLGGLLTAFLPHVLVMVGNYGEQNIGGLAMIHNNLRPAFEGKLKARGSQRPPLECVLVASPVPEDLWDRTSAQKTWREAFGMELTDSLIEIPYDRKVVFTDRLMAHHGEPASRVRLAYEGLNNLIQAWHDDNLVISRQIETRQSERPEDYAELIARGRTAHERGKRFEERVAHLLRLLGYEVEVEQFFDGNRVDLVAIKKGDFGQVTTYLVECKSYSGAVPKEAAEKLDVWLTKPQAKERRARGMLIAERDFSVAALTYCRADSERLLALTYADLERGLFDFAPYLRRLRARYEASALARHYIDQRVVLEKQPQAGPVDLLPHAMEWANGKGGRLWLLLGDYGTGKTSFAQRFAYELALRCESDPDTPIPLAINLRDIPNASDLETLLAEHMRRELDQAVNPDILLHLLNAGRIVLLLDSFDEMGVAQAGHGIEEQFRRLAAPTARTGDDVRGNRVFITSRTHFFKEHSALRQTAQGGAGPADPESPLGRAARAFDATLDELPPFSTPQIQAYLNKRLGEAEGRAAWVRIEAIYGLPQLAAVPQLLDIILETLPELSAKGVTASPGALYYLYTQKWLNDGRYRLREMALGAEQVALLLERLSCLLWARDDKRLHYADLAKAVREYSPEIAAGLDHERTDLELRTAAFLVRSPDGYYRFSHKSFLEFFVARQLWHALGASDSAALVKALDTAPLNAETVHMLGDLLVANQPARAKGQAKPGPYDGARRYTAHLLVHAYRPRVSENAVLLGYHLAAHDVGLKPGQSPAPWEEAISPEQPAGFAAFHQAQKAHLPEHPHLEGARFAGLALPGLYLAGAHLRGAALARCDLEQADLSGADLNGAHLDDANLLMVNLHGAVLEHAHLARCAAHGADLGQCRAAHSDWRGAKLNAARLGGADLSGASLALVRLADADLTKVKAAGTDFAGASAPRARLATTLTRRLAHRPPTHPSLPRIPGHLTEVTACALSADSRRVLTASGDNTARLWDAETGAELVRYSGHENAVTACALSADGRRVLTASWDKTARLWDAETGTELVRYSGHENAVRACALSADGRHVLTASGDNTARLWDAETGAELVRYSSHENAVTACALSADGRRVLTASGDNTARLWDAETGAELVRYSGHEDSVTACALSADGRRVLTASGDNTARLWDAETGAELVRYSGHEDSVTACVLSADGRRVLIASWDSTARLWEAETGKELVRYSGHEDAVTACALSADGQRVLTASVDNTARLWDAETGAELVRYSGHENGATACALSADGRRVLTASRDQMARLWDAETGTELVRYSGHENGVTACVLSGDGRRVLTASGDNTTRLWDVETGKELIRYSGHENEVTACALSADGRRVLTASWDNTACLWDAETGTELVRYSGHENPVTACALSADGRCVLTASWDNTARLWDAETGAELVRYCGHESAVTACALSADGRRVLTASWDNTARLWDAETGAELVRYCGHESAVTACALSADGRRVLTASWDNTARLWDAETGVELVRYSGHEGAVTACVLSADGRRVLTASDDKTTRLWDAETGAELRAHLHAPDGWAAWTPDGRWRGTGGVLARLYFLDRDEKPAPGGFAAGWLPTRWIAADLPAAQSDISL